MATSVIGQLLSVYVVCPKSTSIRVFRVKLRGWILLTSGVFVSYRKINSNENTEKDSQRLHFSLKCKKCGKAQKKKFQNHEHSALLSEGYLRSVRNFKLDGICNSCFVGANVKVEDQDVSGED